MDIKKRIQILLLFLVAVPLLLLLYESYQTSRNTLIAEMKKEALQIALLQTAEIDRVFETPRTIVDGLVRSLENDPLLRPEGIRELLTRTLHETPEIYGVGIALDPALTHLKHFAPYAFRPKGVETLISLPYEYTHLDWYRIPLKSGKGTWIDPYYDEAGKALMVTYAVPLKRNGVVVGIVGVDLGLEGLVHRLHALKPGSNGRVYLVNQAGRIVAHPDLKPIADLPGSKGLGEMALLMKRRGLDATKMQDPVTRRTSWVVESPISTLSAERGGGDWSLIVSWPLDKKLAPLNGMGRRMIVLYLFLGGAALWFLNRTIDDTIIRPIRRLTEQAREYSEGNFSQHIDVQYDTLELRELGLALKSLRLSSEKKDAPDTGIKEDVQ